MSTAERRAENENRFREANEQIRHVQEELELPAAELPFLCECEDPRCTEIVRLTPAEYEQIRANGRRFAVATGHDDAGKIVSRAERFDTVEKQGLEGEIVQEADPREGS